MNYQSGFSDAKNSLLPKNVLQVIIFAEVIQLRRYYMFYFLPTLLKIVKEDYFCTIVKKTSLHEIKGFLSDRDPLGKKILIKSNKSAGFYDNC